MSWLFCFRISKGLSEKVFAKSEEQGAAEEVEDTGKIVQPLACDLRLQNYAESNFNLSVLSRAVIHTDIYRNWHHVLFMIQVGLFTFYSARFLGLIQEASCKKSTLVTL